ncbi:hypothetical protein LI328DRAFT_160951 [Trichoderma asperelloides]|nr:hypothetical protein LI328DRAFT_160951 [Trichoderma asperelloides]
MPKRTDERLEELEVVHETLEMMIQLIKDLGFEPPPKISQYQGPNGAKAASPHDERLNGIYEGYASMLENRERLKIKIYSLTAQNAEMACTVGKKSVAEEPSDSHSQQNKASSRRAKRRGDPWDRPKKRRRQLTIKQEKISKSPLSNEFV